MEKNLHQRKKLALLIPAYNEELLLGQAIKSAIAAGLPARDIFVVDDASLDQTAAVAKKLLRKKHVLTLPHSGKAMAIAQGFKHFNIERRYEWIHIADADGVFAPDYFEHFLAGLKDEYVAATGFVQSLPGGWISKFRVYEYGWGQIIMRRLQKMLGAITVIPGPTSCFKTDLVKHLNFEADCATEDFDITLQIHRQKLGVIGYIPEAKAYTQDPQNFRDYRQQITRWHRGFFQGILNNRVGLRPQMIDLYLGFLMLDMFIYYSQLLIIYPLLLIIHHDQFLRTASLLFVYDAVMFFVVIALMGLATKRRDIINAFPLYYLLRFAQMGIFLKAFFDVVITRRRRHHQVGWETQNRRYVNEEKGS